MAADLSHKLYDILAAGWRQRYVVAVPVLMMPILGGFVGTMTPPVYQSHTSLLVQEPEFQNPTLEDLAVPIALPDRKAGLQELLRSRHVLGSVVDDLSLVPDGPDTERLRDIEINKLRASLGVQFIGKDMIRINYSARSPQNMKEVLQKVSDACVDQILAPGLTALDSSVEFLSGQIEAQKAVLDAKERTLAEFKDRHTEELPEFLSQNMTRISDVKQTLAEKDSALAGARETLDSIGEQLARNNPVVGHLEEQIVQIRGELALLSARYTSRHSKVQAAERQLERLEAERERLLASNDHGADIERMLQTPMGRPADDSRSTNTLLVAQLERYQDAKTQVEILEREVARLERTLKEAESRSDDVGALAQRLQDMERDIKVQRTLYEDLLSRREMARVKSSLGRFEQSERIKVIDVPFTPRTATNLPLAIFVIGGVFAGIALGVSLATVLELMDGTIRSRRSLESLTQLPMLTRIPPLSVAEAPAGAPISIRPVRVVPGKKRA